MPGLPIRHPSLSSSPLLFVLVHSLFATLHYLTITFSSATYRLLFHHTSRADYIHSAMPPRTGSQWDHKSDKDLLLAIIDSGALKGIDWKVISEKMTAKGYTFTHEACRYVNSFEPFFFTSLPFRIFNLSFHLCSIKLCNCPYVSHSYVQLTNASLANTFKRSARSLATALPTPLSPLLTSRAPAMALLKNAPNALLMRMVKQVMTKRF